MSTESNHFSCRSVVREIQVGTEEAESVQPTSKEELKDLPIIEGFDSSLSVSWWQESDSMKKRAERYGLDKEFKEKKNILLKNSEKDSTINNEKDFATPKSLGAMAKKFYVEKNKELSNFDFYIKEGTYVTGVKSIAAGAEIKEINRLIDEFPLQKWKKNFKKRLV